MEYLISALWIGLELGSIFLFASAFLTRRQDRKVSLLFFIFLWVILWGLNNISIFQSFSYIIRYGIIFFVSFYLFSGAWYVHVFLEIIVFLFLLIIDSVVTYGTSVLLNISLSELVWRKWTYSAIGTLGKLLGLLCSWLVFRFRNSHGFRGISGKWFALTLLFPIVSVVILVLNYFNNQGSEDLSIGVLLISLVLAIANIGIIYLIHTLESATIQEQEMALLKQQMMYQKENYLALEGNYASQRKATHEFERHLQTLCDLMDREEYATAYDYVLQLQRNKTLRVYHINTNHPVFDIILNQKHQIAREKNIHIRIQINNLTAVQIPTDLLVVLLSNVLDNAIEACQKLTSGKEIYCSILHNDSLYISVRNTSLPVVISNGKIATDKPGTLEHGYGIPAIRFILDQLNAEYTFEYKNGWFQFVAEIPL